MEFKLKSVYKGWFPLRPLVKASATVIPAGSMVTLASGLAIKWVAASTALAYAPFGAGDGETEVMILDDPKAEFTGKGDAVFAVAQRGTEVDLVGTTTQLIDVGASSTDVFKISVDKNAGTVGSTDDIAIRINKFLY